LALGNIGNRFLEFAFGVILARLLVPANFGMIVTIQVFTGFVGMLISGGMGQSLIHAKSNHDGALSCAHGLRWGRFLLDPFLLLPIPALISETARLRQKLNGGLSLVLNTFT
jgi:O-antigen/teichoic acid export membrane protein